MRRSRRAGFGMIEMLIAVFLLAGGIASTAYVIPMASRGLSHAKVVTTAAFFAQQRMEEALVSPSPEAVEVHPDVPELTGEIQRVAYNLEPSLYYTRVIIYHSDDPSRKPIVELETLGKGAN